MRDAIEADPEAFLGADHVARFGADPALLVKLLDAGQRLPVHFHPGRDFAARELGLAHGKTEAWLIVEADPGASVWVGFSREVGLDEVRGVDGRPGLRGDAGRRCTSCRSPPATRSSCPAGAPHAIGAGILMVEVQEPTDLSVLLEWDGFELTEDDGHLGLGWDTALQALDRSAWDEERVGALRGRAPGRSLLPAAADPWFRAERVRGGDELDAGFSILVGLAGSGDLDGVPFGRGTALLVPHAAGPLTRLGRRRGDPWEDPGMDGRGVASEVGTLATVILHRPGSELLRLTPRNNDELLFDGVPWVARAQAEHDAFAATLRGRGVEVLYVRELLEQTLARRRWRRTRCSTRRSSCSRSGRRWQERLRELLSGLPRRRSWPRCWSRGSRARSSATATGWWSA